MTDEDPQEQIEDTRRETDEELGELDGQADDMEERLAEHESEGEDVEVPEPDKGDDLSISTAKDKEAAEVGDEESPASEEGVPEDQDEAAEEAGQ